MRRHISPDYKAAVLATSGLVGYWRLDEAAGTVARDAMGLNHGTYVGSPTLGAVGLLAGDPDAAVTLNGTTQYLTIPDSASFDCFEGTHPWTIGFLVAATPDVTYRNLLGKTDAAAASYLAVSSSDASISVSRFGAANSDAQLVPFTPGTHDVIWTYDGARWTFYADGAIQPATGGYANPRASAQSLGAMDALQFGFHPYFAAYLAGTLDEIPIWDRALTADEAAWLYRVGMGR